MYTYPSGDTEVPHVPRMLVIVRKEIRNVKQFRIVGRVGDVPDALKPFREYASIPDQRTDGNTLYIDTRIFSNYRDELSDEGLGKFEFRLELPDHREIIGSVHAQRGILDYSSSLSGAHMQTHMIVHDAQGYHAYQHVEEVQDNFDLFSRRGRIVFEGTHLVDAQMPYMVFVVKGYQREWRYRFNFTNDPNVAAEWSDDHMMEQQ
jgi:hypothetical protein